MYVYMCVYTKICCVRDSFNRETAGFFHCLSQFFIHLFFSLVRGQIQAVEARMSLGQIFGATIADQVQGE